MFNDVKIAGGKVKRVIFVVILAITLMLVGCSKQRALDQVMEDSDMRSYLLQQMLADEGTRAEMADSILNDSEITDAFLSGLVENELERTDLLDRILVVDSTGEWITGKLAENPDLKAKMRAASRR
jgi:PBP1b-binding outer membrane lipoprotein LpoB